MRLIDVNALIDYLQMMPIDLGYREVEEIEEYVRSMPTIEPQRKKGHWIRHPEQRNIFNGKTIECSECHEKYTVQYVEDECFCRHCGADMRGDSNADVKS